MKNYDAFATTHETQMSILVLFDIAETLWQLDEFNWYNKNVWLGVHVNDCVCLLKYEE